MERIKGTNLGNWLVLEKWMLPEMFDGTDAEDETWLNRTMDTKLLGERMKKHRDTYVTEETFKNIADHGLNLVRIPVPYFVFGDRPPYHGCIEYLDKAFDWAEKYNLKVLVDLHTSPGCQNSYDNGGLTGVCKFSQDPAEVEFVLSVLTRLAERYKDEPALYGIEVLNEPISFLVYLTAPSRKKAADPAEAKGSHHITTKFLKKFYQEAYARLSVILPEDKKIVFHDGFRLGTWKDFFAKNGMDRAVLDTHIYIHAMEMFEPIYRPWVYRLYLWTQKCLLKRASKYTPVVVGEWSLSCRYAFDGRLEPKERTRRYRLVKQMQEKTWEVCAGDIYWSYQLNPDTRIALPAPDREPWDLHRCWDWGWM